MTVSHVEVLVEEPSMEAALREILPKILQKPHISIYPRVSKSTPERAKYRDPDAIAGGTWEAFERILQNAGYFKWKDAPKRTARRRKDLNQPH
jgi:hypothetical protein